MPMYKSEAGFAIFARVIESPLGEIDLGEWKEFEGGELTAEAFKVRPPGQPQQAHPNPIRETGDFTIRRDFSLELDWGLRKRLRVVAGLARVQVAVSPLDNANGWWQEGGNDTYSGILNEVHPNTINRDEGATAAVFELVCGADETVA